MPCPYNQFGVGTRHCRLLACHSGAAGIDMTDRVGEMNLSNRNFDDKFAAFTGLGEALQFAVVFFNDNLVRN